jgi:hypothetical protein
MQRMCQYTTPVTLDIPRLCCGQLRAVFFWLRSTCLFAVPTWSGQPSNHGRAPLLVVPPVGRCDSDHKTPGCQGAAAA